MADIDPSSLDPRLLDVLESAARLQELVPDTTLVGGSAAAMYAGHRISFDHDHVTQLAERFDAVIDALDDEPEWVMNRTTPGKIILGRLGGIEAGVRQLIRKRPLEVAEVRLPSGRTLTVPTPDEALRVKAFLLIRRNQTRDYLDVAALSDRYGIDPSAAVLSGLDAYYADESKDGVPVSTQVARQLADPRPADLAHVDLTNYKALDPKWHDWRTVAAQTRRIAAAMLTGED